MTAGKQGCPCTNETATLSSLTERICEVASTGETGIRLGLGGSCVPTSYGSSQCLQHDLHDDPACISDGDGTIPAYCFQPWCYVNADVCARDSKERVYRSSYFSFDSGVDIFYSYSTCNSTSTADDWREVVNGKVTDVNMDLGQIAIKANIPDYQFPLVYKRDPTSEESLSVTGSEYYDNNIPYEGIYPIMMENLVKSSKGGIKNITYTHRSNVSSVLHPKSSFTAAVQDIQDGLVDMSVGPFWITSERLLMAAFSVPVVNDKVYLVVPTPGSEETIPQQISKIFHPFSVGVWGLVGGIIILSSLLSVWFSDRTELASDSDEVQRPLRRNKHAYLRLAVDSILEKGIFFCSAGVEQDVGATLSNKLLMFGFGSFILIAVSSYVANLAAFLTRRTLEGSVTSIDGAIAGGWTICAHHLLRKKLSKAWPAANFVFTERDSNHHDIMDDYTDEKCQALAISWEGTSMDHSFLDRVCERKLVYTDSIFIQIPIGFPIRKDLAAGCKRLVSS
mmetsp:Transcript_383/g.621  ORF Transcript_383/g.621 Transcript_383/m.621 type:complete len:507 (-) Transcript_383:907-2427(-)